MEFRHLRYFIAVGEEQHFGRAAQRLRVAQPALSRQIQDLERELGFKLFDRLPRGVELNAAGKAFLTEARHILLQNQDAISQAKRIAQGQVGTLKIAFTQSLAWQGIFTESLRLFRAKFPGVDFQLTPMPSTEQFPQVQSGKIDAGFAFTMTPISEELDEFRFGFVTLLLAVPAKHPLTKKKRVRLKDLVEERFIWAPRWSNPLFVDTLVAECARGGLTNIHIGQEAASEPIMLSLVACGAGVAFVSTCSQRGHPLDTVLLPVSDLKMRLPCGLIWRKDNKTHLMVNFVSELRRLVDKERRL
jgi:DNA-binding transcriptional LysR family regulator